MADTGPSDATALRPAPGALLERTLAAIAPLDPAALAAATARQQQLTKPPGSLGRLEDVSVRLSGLAAACPPPRPEPAAVAVFAADHGVTAQGVSAWPQEVTVQMVLTFLAAGAAVNVLARQLDTQVVVVDVGVAGDLPDADPDPALGPDGRVPGHGVLLPRRVRSGTADLSVEPAMTRAEALAAVEVGIDVAGRLVRAGYRCLLTGDMGIANTTASAALIAVFCGTQVDAVTGLGGGIDDAARRRKVAVIETALALHRPDPADPIGVLAAVGGLEHAALAGFVLGAAAERVPVVLDGVIAGSAALVAAALCPDSVAACIAGHRSVEPGHTVALRRLGLEPLVDLGLRLGEGSGALLALPIVQAAARTLAEMATFESAAVAGPVA